MVPLSCEVLPEVTRNRRFHRSKSLAKDLGIADQSLRNWVKQSDLDTGRRTDGLTTEERIELRRLRRENRILQEER